MIVSRCSYRCSISGGSTDYRSFFERYGSILTGLSLDKYCYVVVKPLTKVAESNFEIYYSNTEKVKQISDIKNATVRGTLEFFNQKHPLHTLSIYIANDCGHQSGLATSSALVVALLNALYRLKDIEVTKKQLADDAIFVERCLLQQSGGVQDSYFCAYGGLNSLSISKNGDMLMRPLPVSEKFTDEFCQSSLLFYLSSERSSYEIAASHDNLDADKFKKEIMRLSEQTKKAFEKEDVESVGRLLNENWLNKRQISSLISNPYIDSIYNKAMAAKAYGCKILGTGGSGYLFTIFNKENRQEIIHKMGLPYITVGIDYEGTKILLES